MSNKIIGIDPDCKKSGLAIYQDGELCELKNLSLPEYISFLMDLEKWRLEGFHSEIAIEDSSLNSFFCSRNSSGKDSLHEKLKRAMRTGRIQQQSILMGELAEFYGVPVTRYKPCAGNFQKTGRKAATNCAMLNAATGWDKKSNEETRSAAYFGYKHLKAIK